MKLNIELPKGKYLNGEDLIKVDDIDSILSIMKVKENGEEYINTFVLGEMPPYELISLIRDLLMGEDVAEAILDFGEELESNEMAKEVPALNGFKELAQFVKLQQDWGYLKEAMREGKNVGITSEIM